MTVWAITNRPMPMQRRAHHRFFIKQAQHRSEANPKTASHQDISRGCPQIVRSPSAFAVGMRRKKSSVLRRRSASELKRLRAAFAAAFERQLGRVPLLFFFFSFPFFSFLAYVSEHADGEQRGALADLNLPNDASRRDLSRPPLRSIPSLGVCCPHASSKKK